MKFVTTVLAFIGISANICLANIKPGERYLYTEVHTEAATQIVTDAPCIQHQLAGRKIVNAL